MRRSVIVVEDEDSVRDLLVRWLEASGYVVAPARNAEDALARLEASPAAVALCDIRMPGKDGLWLAGRIRQRFPDTAVIMSTGVQDVHASIESMRNGVVDYLTKPFGRDRLRDAVARGVEWHQAAWDARRWSESLQHETAELRRRLEETVRKFAIASDDALDAMLVSTLLSSHGAYAHAHRVAGLSVRTGIALGLHEHALLRLNRGALVHDLGKLVIPDAVLRKPAPLTRQEQALVRTWPVVTAAIISEIPFLSDVAPIVRGIHDPSCALQEARIITVADAFDAMTHARPHRDAIAPAEALIELQRCTATQFDPVVTRLFAGLPNFR